MKLNQNVISVADLEGAEPSLTVLLICDNGTILWRHHRHFYLFKHVKHGTQNIQNDCHQWLCNSFRANQIRFRPGLRPGPRWGAYSAPLDLLAGLRGQLLGVWRGDIVGIVATCIAA